MKLIFTFLFLFATSAQAQMFEDGASFGQANFASSYNETSSKCEQEQYFEIKENCNDQDVAQELCPYNPAFAKKCVNKSEFKYSTRIELCQRMSGVECTYCLKGAGYTWRGSWTECEEFGY